jgi:PAS domain S-box-containing protein
MSDSRRAKHTKIKLPKRKQFQKALKTQNLLLEELDRISKMLVRRDLERVQLMDDLEKEFHELDKTAKLLVRRDFELSEIREKSERELAELDQIAKMLIRRDLELSQLTEKRENELKELRETRTALMNILEDMERSRAALMNILEDIEQERRKAEEEKNKTLSIITNFVDGLLLFGIDRKLQLINPQAEKILGLKTEDAIGKSISELSFFKNMKPLAALLEEKMPRLFRKEVQLGDNLVLEITTVPIKIEKEESGTMVILHDVTREKVVERMKSEFVSLAAHQLRTPLSAIKWTLRMLLDRELGEITPEQQEFLEKTYESNERMISLINDLLDVTRIEEGRYIYRTTLIGLESIVQSVIDSYKTVLEKKELKFELRKPETPLPLVLADVEKIKIVVQNIIDNAIRYTDKGGKVTITLKYGKRELECSVSDTGVGIPLDQQSRVFSKFFRGANALRMEPEGSGLGLFIVKNIIEAHGGRIWFESEEGKGTTFYFTLPVEEKFAESSKEL